MAGRIELAADEQHRALGALLAEGGGGGRGGDPAPDEQVCDVSIGHPAIVVPPYRICIPEIARAMTMRWISLVPSKIV